jgi:endonuclease/exonuclease/phosphatase family metal-dependent hydrolase
MAQIKALPEMPTVIMGDFNERRTRPAALGCLSPHFGIHETPGSFPSVFPVFALDRILGWPMGLVTCLSVHDTPLARSASDHLPLTAALDKDFLRR